MEASQLFGVKGLVAVITGGGSGLGLVMAKALEANGAAKVFIVGRNLEKLERAAAEGRHGNIIPLHGDVTSKDDLISIAATVKEAVGFVNLVVANAGTNSMGQFIQGIDSQSTIEEVQNYMLSRPWEAYTEQFNLHVTAALYTAMAFLMLLDAGNKKGNIGYTSQFITTGSAQGFNKSPLSGLGYSTSKAAATHLSKSLANFLAPWNIRSNMIAPGFYVSEMTAPAVAWLKDSDGKFPSSLSPMRRTGEPDEIASLILMLASAGGSYCNGSVFLSDGGRLCVNPSVF